MKFSHKVFFSTLLIIALAFSIGSAVLIDAVFYTSMEREGRAALDGNQALRFSFAAAASSAMTTADNYGLIDPLSDSTVRRIGWSMERNNDFCIRISNERHEVLYVSKNFESGRIWRLRPEKAAAFGCIFHRRGGVISRTLR